MYASEVYYFNPKLGINQQKVGVRVSYWYGGRFYKGMEADTAVQTRTFRFGLCPSQKGFKKVSCLLIVRWFECYMEKMSTELELIGFRT